VVVFKHLDSYFNESLGNDLYTSSQICLSSKSTKGSQEPGVLIIRTTHSYSGGGGVQPLEWGRPEFKSLCCHICVIPKKCSNLLSIRFLNCNTDYTHLSLSIVKDLIISAKLMKLNLQTTHSCGSLSRPHTKYPMCTFYSFFKINLSNLYKLWSLQILHVLLYND
jgi:hypothetical protein